MNGRARTLTMSKPAILPVPNGMLHRACACGHHGGMGGECEECKKKQGDMLERRALSSRPMAQVPSIVHEVLRSPGQPLDAATRRFMEPRFGRDFSAVRVHTDARAAASAQAVNALAYTVGDDIVFGRAGYAPESGPGKRLLAHELTHVVQQGGSASGWQAKSILDENHSTEREAEALAEKVTRSAQPSVIHRSAGPVLQRHPDDLVVYSGGQSGTLMSIQAGRLSYRAAAVSGHPGHGENEPGAGPIPSGRYVMHPGITRGTVSTLEGGVCGARAIRSGYQEITSTDPSPCSGAHYCNVPCPTAAEPGRKCFTPRDCWGPMRIKMEGRKAVVTPSGRRTFRDGFYLHGGNPSDAVSRGCIKALDNGIFPEIRKLTGVRGSVPLCVGPSCQPAVGRAYGAAAADLIEQAASAIGDLLVD